MERRLIDQFVETLRELPEVQVDHVDLEPRESGAPDSRRRDARIGLNVAGRLIDLWLEVRKTVYPRDAREFLWEFGEGHGRAHRGQLGGAPSLLVAESISPGAKELLRSERFGYYDSGGSIYLTAPGAYIYIDKAPPKTLERSVRSLFSGRRAQVVHALLGHRQEWFGVNGIAATASVSPATASQVLTELDRFDWLVSRGQGPGKERHLREPAALLDAWVKHLGNLRPPDLRRYFVPGLTADVLPDHFGRMFEAHGVGYAISHEAAAQRYAPYLSSVSQVRVRMMAGSGSDAAIAELGARVVNEGANLAIIEVKSSGELLFREQVGGIWLASPVQVYLDLLRGEGRAKEMAEHLRKERIGF